MQNISNDQTKSSKTLKDSKEFNLQPLAIQAKKSEQPVSMTFAVKKGFDLMGDVIVDLSTADDALRNKIVSYDEKWLQESKAKLLKQLDDEKRANLVMFRMKKNRLNPIK